MRPASTGDAAETDHWSANYPLAIGLELIAPPHSAAGNHTKPTDRFLAEELLRAWRLWLNEALGAEEEGSRTDYGV